MSFAGIVPWLVLGKRGRHCSPLSQGNNFSDRCGLDLTFVRAGLGLRLGKTNQKVGRRILTSILKFHVLRVPCV